jgi:hypothetical protein
MRSATRGLRDHLVSISEELVQNGRPKHTGGLVRLISRSNFTVRSTGGGPVLRPLADRRQPSQFLLWIEISLAFGHSGITLKGLRSFRRAPNDKKRE